MTENLSWSKHGEHFYLSINTIITYKQTSYKYNQQHCSPPKVTHTGPYYMIIFSHMLVSCSLIGRRPSSAVTRFSISVGGAYLNIHEFLDRFRLEWSVHAKCVSVSARLKDYYHKDMGQSLNSVIFQLAFFLKLHTSFSKCPTSLGSLHIKLPQKKKNQYFPTSGIKYLLKFYYYLFMI